MTKVKSKFAEIAAVGVLFALMTNSATAQQAKPQADQKSAQPDGLTIQDQATLAKTYIHAAYALYFHANGNSVPPLRWKIAKGALPPGFVLEESGFLHGVAERGDEYHFTISVTDSGSPVQSVQKEFALTVQEGMTLAWKTPPQVAGSRIDGVVEVSNLTADEIDLTFVVLAVAEDGRATAIGYQHFQLKPNVPTLPIKFGETLPHGNYVVHADLVGEVAKRGVIYRQRLQTPGPLQVLVGP